MKNKTWIVFSLFLVCSSLNLLGQNISGHVLNENFKPIPFANVVIKSSIDSSFIAYSQANSDGHYEITMKNPGDYLVDCSNISYKKTIQTIHLEKNQFIKLDLFLSSSPIVLGEVKIDNNIPILIKKDTIEFNASSFLKGNEVVVEDLLKNLPGIEVDNEGVIRANGKEIEKVMVESDDFLQKGYSLLTKSMPSSSVRKVELIQKYNENSLMKGIEQSDKVALNIKLKDDAKRKWIGNINAHLGVTDKHELQSNAMNFGKKNSYFLTGNKNNTSYNAIKDISRISIMDQEDLLISAPLFIEMEPILPDIEESRFNFNDAQIVSANAIFKSKEKLKVQLSNRNNILSYLLV